ncbi:MAG: hypothetical protein L3J28_14745 [Candidatus Polarisedimenticolaceae bacterium]|nr:hypothetical protein [Candidatus Polarisedimenticolaceae bacterium]
MEHDAGHEEEHEDAHEGHADHDEENSRVELSSAQRKTAGVIVKTLQAKPMMAEIQAPGEIHLNAYATTKVTPRIAAQVLARHKRQGRRWKKATLWSPYPA